MKHRRCQPADTFPPFPPAETLTKVGTAGVQQLLSRAEAGLAGKRVLLVCVGQQPGPLSAGCLYKIKMPARVVGVVWTAVDLLQGRRGRGISTLQHPKLGHGDALRVIASALAATRAARCPNLDLPALNSLCVPATACLPSSRPARHPPPPPPPARHPMPPARSARTGTAGSTPKGESRSPAGAPSSGNPRTCRKSLPGGE